MLSEADVLKSYTSHKTVRAAEILNVGNYFQTGDGLFRHITLAGGVTISLPQAMFLRYVPEYGDFYVVYEDGYRSFSPRKAFVDGYAPVGQSFAEIKQGIKDGKANPDQA